MNELNTPTRSMNTDPNSMNTAPDPVNTVNTPMNTASGSVNTAPGAVNAVNTAREPVNPTAGSARSRGPVRRRPQPDAGSDSRGAEVLMLRGAAPRRREGPPHDADAEQCVLGAMLLSAEAATDVAQVMDPCDHYQPAHETIHRTIQTMYDAGRAVDPITVARELDQAADLHRVGGAEYLHALVHKVPNPAHAASYAEIVRDKAARRQLIECGTRLVQAASAAD
ncbi:hypothetical protein JJV70_22260, partial [Streptomyces sp. JJ66]|uniref:DnaB-like helicase N-terminal domain-containing protein n=1 Tax=Streptomyces sp. JJ66 TaxID=2803843 RepID=UPI001C5C543C